LALLIALSAVAASRLSPYFLDAGNLLDSTFNVAEVAMIALGMSALIVAREIDLSVAAIVALSSLAMGWAAAAGFGAVPLLGVGLAVGALAGSVNGALVTRLRLPSIVVTIGTMSLFRGLAQVALGDGALTKYPQGLLDFGQGYLAFGVPNSTATFALLAMAAGAILHFTPLGRAIFAIGANPTSARFSGLPVDRIRFGLFVVSGLLSGLAAWFLTGRIGSTRPDIATGWELEAVTMAILGGVAITGGAGTVAGVVLAVVLLDEATFAMQLLNVPGVVIDVALGSLLIVTLAAPEIARRALGRLWRP
ncbi:MAG: ABC transporter permease, partial [Hyphomicrobiales bacterium]|nr:ABC transporter permease [Hyphomicrobiales bacterium]